MSDIEKEVYISIYLDTRRIKKNGKFPVKLRVATPFLRTKQKLYKTKYEFDKKEFEAIMIINPYAPNENKKKQTKEYVDRRNVKIKLNTILNEANGVADKISH